MAESLADRILQKINEQRADFCDYLTPFPEFYGHTNGWTGESICPFVVLSMYLYMSERMTVSEKREVPKSSMVGIGAAQSRGAQVSVCHHYVRQPQDRSTWIYFCPNCLPYQGGDRLYSGVPKLRPLVR